LRNAVELFSDSLPSTSLVGVANGVALLLRDVAASLFRVAGFFVDASFEFFGVDEVSEVVVATLKNPILIKHNL
jgi:hypothetical protein